MKSSDKIHAKLINELAPKPISGQTLGSRIRKNSEADSTRFSEVFATSATSKSERSAGELAMGFFDVGWALLPDGDGQEWPSYF